MEAKRDGDTPEDSEEGDIAMLTTTLALLREQAERSAWKILSDSVDIDLSLVEINQVEFLQKFLAYVMVDGKTKETFYDRLKTNGFKMLEAPR